MASTIDYELDIKVEKAIASFDKVLTAFASSAKELGIKIGDGLGKNLSTSVSSAIKNIPLSQINATKVLRIDKSKEIFDQVRNEIANIKISKNIGLEVNRGDVTKISGLINDQLKNGALTPAQASTLFSSLEGASKTAGITAGRALPVSINEGARPGIVTFAENFKANLLANLGADAIKGIGSAIGSSISDGLNASIKFERAISGIKALNPTAKAAEKEIRALTIQLGNDTKFSALEAAQGFAELIKAGVELKDIMGGGGLKGSLDLAAAGGITVADAADTASIALNVFKKDGISVTRAADLLAGTANASATNVKELQDALRSAATVSDQSGQSFESTAVALALLAQNGFKGGRAGTSLRTFFSNLIPRTKKATEAMERLGLITEDTSGQFTNNQFLDANKNFKDIREITELLTKSTDGLSESAKNSELYAIFGSDAIRAGLIFSKEGAKGFDKLKESINSLSAETTAKEMLDNLAGSIEKFNGTLETKQIEFFGGSIGTFLTRVVTGFDEALKGIDLKDLSDAFGELGLAIADLSGIGDIKTGLKDIAKIVLREIVLGIKDLTEFFKYLKKNPEVAKLLTSIAVAIGLLVLALGGLLIIGGIIILFGTLAAVLNPVTLAIAGIVFALGFLGTAFATNLGGIRTAIEVLVLSARIQFDIFSADIQDLPRKIGNAFNKLGNFFKKAGEDIKKGFDDMIKGAVDFRQGVDKEIAGIGDEFNKIGEDINKGFEDGKQSLIEFVKFIGDEFNKVGKEISKALEPINKAFDDAFGSPLKELQTAFSEFEGAIDQLGSKIGTAFSFELVKAGESFNEFNNSINNTLGFLGTFGNILLQIVGNALKPIADTVFTFIDNVIKGGYNRFVLGSGLIGQVFEVLFGIIGSALSTIGNLIFLTISGVISGVIETLVLGFTLIAGLIGEVFGNILTVISPILTAALNFIVIIFTGMFIIIGTILKFIVQGVTNAFFNILEAIKGIGVGIIQILTGIFQLLTGVITGNSDKILQGFLGILSGIGGILLGLGNIIVSPFRSAFEGVVGLISKFDFIAIGRNIVNGIVEGIKNTIGGVGSALNNGLSGAINGVRQLLDMNSPSRLFEKEIGENMILGAVEGIENLQPLLDATLKDSFDISNLTNAIKATPIVNNNNNTNSSSNSTVINNNQKVINYGNNALGLVLGGQTLAFDS